jgi:hypothetical protein
LRATIGRCSEELFFIGSMRGSVIFCVDLFYTYFLTVGYIFFMYLTFSYGYIFCVVCLLLKIGSNIDSYSNCIN